MKEGGSGSELGSESVAKERGSNFFQNQTLQDF